MCYHGMRTLYSQLIKKINANSKSQLKPSRLNGALIIASSVLKQFGELKTLIKSPEAAKTQDSMLKLRLAMYKLIQKVAKSLLDKKMKIDD